MAVYEVTVRSGSSSRNLATTNDPFSFLFGETPEEDDADSDDDSSSVTNPFSSASMCSVAPCLLLVALALLC